MDTGTCGVAVVLMRFVGTSVLILGRGSSRLRLRLELELELELELAITAQRSATLLREDKSRPTVCGLRSAVFCGCYLHVLLAAAVHTVARNGMEYLLRGQCVSCSGSTGILVCRRLDLQGMMETATVAAGWNEYCRCEQTGRLIKFQVWPVQL
ncbi:hypothetical protein HD806DRAFT_112503 [Xylariaceae sp. AK1471]|nr:hypothetical protein HD806DRAFT_112503 [Xylariaceae sp. AK1471]